MPEDFSSRVFNLLKARKQAGHKMTKDQLAVELGVSRTMLYNYEQSDPDPPAEVLSRLAALELAHLPVRMSTELPALRPMMVAHERPQTDCRNIPVIGWAHAGAAAVYEELPKDWQDWVPTECRDERAFAVTLEGDSMEPRFADGDVLVLMPSEEAYSGCFAVCRFRDDGVVLRRVEFAGEKIQLVPLNARYDVSSYGRDEFSWIYPVWGRWSQLWKR